MPVDLTRLVLEGESVAILEALREPATAGRLLRKIAGLLSAADPRRKWRAVAAMGLAAGPGKLPADRLDRQIERFLWAMNDESGAVPFGIPEVLGEILIARPELRQRLLPKLVVYVSDKNMFQEGAILAGALWALGRVGVEETAEKRELLPGLKAALQDHGSDVRGAALWAVKRLGLCQEARAEIEALTSDEGMVCLLVDGKVSELAVSELARQALA